MNNEFQRDLINDNLPQEPKRWKEQDKYCPEFETVKGRFVDICRYVAEPDVVEFAGELLQSNLISNAGHQAAIAVTGLLPNNKLSCSRGLRSHEQCQRQLLQVHLYPREQERTTCLRSKE